MIQKSGYNIIFFIILCVLAVFTKPYTCSGQNKPMLGLQLRPIIPAQVFDNTAENFSQNGVNYTVEPEIGFNFGAVIRQRVYRGISIETGINHVKRVYNIKLQDNSFNSNTRFRYISYELPVLGLIYIQLSERAFINNAFGFSFDFFPSNIYTHADSIQHFTIRKFWVLPALTANVGFEYRTQRSGFFYLGGSYHRMLSTMAFSRIEYKQNYDNTEVIIMPLAGHYFSFDFKYFFPLREKDPEPMLY